MIQETIQGIDFQFEADERCFSPARLDVGTAAMLSCVSFQPGQKVLDLGCGWGVVGILAAKFTDPSLVFMVDNSAKAVACAKHNATLNGVGQVHILQSDAYDGLDESQFDLILSNPPYHTDFGVPKRFIEKGFNRLKLNGRFFMVTKRKIWYQNKFTAIFGGVKVREIDGYFVFEAEKRSIHYHNKA